MLRRNSEVVCKKLLSSSFQKGLRSFHGLPSIVNQWQPFDVLTNNEDQRRRQRILSPLSLFNRLEDDLSTIRDHFEGDNKIQNRNLSFFNTGLSLDVIENDNCYEMTLDLPGVKKEDINVTVKDRILTIKGRRESICESKENKQEDQKKNEGKTSKAVTKPAAKYHVKERFYGEFERSLTLPENVEDDMAQFDASFNDGVLTVKLPKKVIKENITEETKILIK